MTDRLGRADLHIHTLASDGTSSVLEILQRVEAEGFLDVIAITDHERIDAAVAGRDLAVQRGQRVEVIVGEEVTTLGGHLVALFLEAPIKPLRSLRRTIIEIHEQGGLAFPAHPLVPYPLCAQGFVLRRLVEDPDPRARPDALETFNPTVIGRPARARAAQFAELHGLTQVGNSDAHAAVQVGQGWTTFPGRTAEDLRASILAGTTHSHGSFHGTASQVSLFGRQLRKYGRDARAELRGRLRRDGTGRDHGYPGGHLRPPRYDRSDASREAGR
ncbi:MAG TPA: PHP domain-containing protein [Candidatus Dormibacteraeota bacterium]|nr:PHP domain-containing protein [Candidatus Dormibacteraeota bacterium]